MGANESTNSRVNNPTPEYRSSGVPNRTQQQRYTPAARVNSPSSEFRSSDVPNRAPPQNYTPAANVNTPTQEFRSSDVPNRTPEQRYTPAASVNNPTPEHRSSDVPNRTPDQRYTPAASINNNTTPEFRSSGLPNRTQDQRYNSIASVNNNLTPELRLSGAPNRAPTPTANVNNATQEFRSMLRTILKTRDTTPPVSVNNPTQELRSSDVPNRTPEQRYTPAARTKPVQANNSSGRALCQACGVVLGLVIYQCSSGHSCCDECKTNRRNCGSCYNLITDIRNLTLESFNAELVSPCPNAEKGCVYKCRLSELNTHLGECVNEIMDCPLKSIYGKCSWRGEIAADLIDHFEEKHEECRQGRTNSELVIENLFDDRTVQLVELGPYRFLIHLLISENEGKFYFTVQLLGAEATAQKWLYELHLYNKRTPQRKYFYTGGCQSLRSSGYEIFNDQNCSVIPISYAETMQGNGVLNYKFYIKRNVALNSKPRNQRRPKYTDLCIKYAE